MSDHTRPIPQAVLLDADDASAFVAEAPACREILALTPAARVRLAGLRTPVRSSLENYTTVGHRRTIIHLRRAEAELQKAFRSDSTLSPAAREALSIILMYVVGASARLWVTLRGPGPWLVRSQDGWRHLNARQDVHTDLLGRIIRARFQTTLWQKFGAPPLPWLARRLSAITARRYRAKGAVILGYGRRQLNRLGDEIIEFAPRRPVLVVRCSRGKWSDYGRIARGLWRAFRGQPRNSLDVLPLGSNGLEDSVRRVLEKVNEPVAQAGIRIAGPELRRAAGLTVGFAAHLKQLFAEVRPSALVSDSLGWGPGAAAGQAARANDVPVYFLSHSSHAAQSRPTARQAVHQWVRHGRVLSRFASTLLPKTPHAARVALAATEDREEPLLAPYVWLSEAKLPERRPDSPFRILHACNFAPWSEHVPWAMQTSDEFVAGIEKLVQVVSLMEGIELVIRPKPKVECNAEVLAQLLPAAANVEIRQGGSFAADLAAADLVAAFSSSSIEEALHTRKPVLLWGGGADYQHLPARLTPPDSRERAAVYAVASRAELDPMLRRIVAAHQGRPLQDHELEDHLWPKGTPGAKEFARRLASSAAASEASKAITTSDAA